MSISGLREGQEWTGTGKNDEYLSACVKLRELSERQKNCEGLLLSSEGQILMLMSSVKHGAVMRALK